MLLLTSAAQLRNRFFNRKASRTHTRTASNPFCAVQWGPGLAWPGLAKLVLAWPTVRMRDECQQKHSSCWHNLSTVVVAVAVVDCWSNCVVDFMVTLPLSLCMPRTRLLNIYNANSKSKRGGISLGTFAKSKSGIRQTKLNSTLKGQQEQQQQHLKQHLKLLNCFDNTPLGDYIADRYFCLTLCMNNWGVESTRFWGFSQSHVDYINNSNNWKNNNKHLINHLRHFLPPPHQLHK